MSKYSHEATDTRNESFWAFDEVELGTKRAEVYSVLKRIGPASDRQIARELKWEFHRTAPRRNELVARGLVERVGTTTDEVTGKKVALWQVVASGQRQMRF
jgi:predicted ArsR family transcriptional regulator